METQNLAAKLGIKIRTLRKAAGLTQGELAEISDMSGSFIGYVERGQQMPSLKMVDRIAYALKLPLKLFFDFAETAETEAEKSERTDEERAYLYEALFLEMHRCTPDDLRALVQVARQLGGKGSEWQGEGE